MNPVTVLLVGAGRFGANYITVLSQIRGKPPAPIGRLVLSRTHGPAAEALADRIGRPFDEVIGIEIKETGQLEAAIHRYSPELTCITARDPHIGDAVHALYAMPALHSGAVLCEKPFSPARGSGDSLAPARALTAHPHARRFGLELPMAVVARAMDADPVLKRLTAGAQTIDFVWQKLKESDDLINDLALHPWSLLPFGGEGEVVGVETTRGRVDIRMRLSAPGRSKGAIAAGIHLAAGGVFRGMRIDDRGFQFCFDGDQVQVWEYAAPWSEVVAGRADRRAARMVLAVANPLRQHIEASLTGTPLVDAVRTLHSQHFLEACRAISGR